MDNQAVYIDEQCGPMKHEFTIIATSIGFFLPLLIMLVMYALSVKALNKEAKAVSAMMPAMRHAAQKRKPTTDKCQENDKSGE